MRRTRFLLAVPLVVLARPSAAPALSPPPAPPAASTRHATAVRHLPSTPCRLFPKNSIFHADISKAPRNKHSKTWLAHMQAGSRRLHPDFGPSYAEQPVPYGIPLTVVEKSHPKVTVHFDYASESDRRRYPLGSDTRIEGGRTADGDRHAIVVDASTCRLYETWNPRKKATGWTAGSGA